MPPRASFDPSNVPTDKIERAVDAARRSGELDVRVEDHERRLGSLEETSSDHEKRLAQGDVGFAELRKDVSNLTGKVGELTDAIKGAVRWALGIVGTLATAAILWAIAHGAHP